jgi:phosphatidylserine/phosphatidylglycerophosphate/cardiolipin synthase-like enzyme
MFRKMQKNARDPRNGPLNRAAPIRLGAALILALASAGVADASDVFLSSDRNPVVVMREEIGAATDSIDAVLYKFDEHSLHKAARKALDRGVAIRIVADAEEARRSRSQLEDLQKAGARIRLWEKGKLHAKFSIVDGKRAVTGSFNWTESAQHKNMELISIADDPALVKRFTEIFEHLWDRAEPEKL